MDSIGTIYLGNVIRVKLLIFIYILNILNGFSEFENSTKGPLLLIFPIEFSELQQQFKLRNNVFLRKIIYI